MPTTTRSPALPALLSSSLLAMVLTGGCTPDVRQLYEQTREEALASPGGAPSAWTPHATLGLAWPLVDDLLSDAVDDALVAAGKPIEVPLPLGVVGRVSPSLTLEQAHLGMATECETCARLEASFSGHLGWKLAAIEGKVPLDAQVDLVVDLVSREVQDGLVVEGVLKRVGVRPFRALKVPKMEADLSSSVAEWIQERLQKEVPRVPIANVGSRDAPLRALRVRPVQEELRIEVLTLSPAATDVADPQRGDADWAVAVDQAALLDLARRAAFEAGPGEFDVAVEPRSLSIDGGTFSMGVRLWRLAGKGWWRDYTIRGHLKVGAKNLKMNPEDVTEVGHSQGAGLADPLAALLKGRILGAIEEGATVARPASQTEKVGGSTLELEVQTAEGAGGRLLVRGSAARKTRKPTKKE